MLASRFLVADAALCAGAFCNFVANVTQCQKSWQALHFVSALKSAKVIILSCVKTAFSEKLAGNR